MSTLTPYLTFNGNAGEAMKFYQSILGGELSMQTFEEAKMAERPEDKSKIIHAALKNDALTLMASDANSSKPANFGDNISMSVSGPDNTKLSEDKSKIIHAALKNDALTLMASDANSSKPANFGDNISMSVSGPDNTKLS